MNIFISDPCPIKSAMHLDIKRRNKMILESAQMLCTALNINGVNAPYKTTHKNHPSNIWVRKSRENYLWLWKHYNKLVCDYTERTGKYHKSGEFRWFLLDQAKILPSFGLTPFVNCAANSNLGISYKHIEDVCEAYRLYLNDRWDNDKLEPKWD